MKAWPVSCLELALPTTASTFDDSRVRIKVPAHGYFVTSAVFHYLGPSFAVLLFARVGVLGVAWLRIAVAALVFAVWRRPWRVLRTGPGRRGWRAMVLLGAVLGLMNVAFYLAIDQFLGPIALAAAGVRTGRNLLALVLAVGGVVLLADVRFAGEPLGFAFAFANCALFAVYIVVGHRVAGDGGTAGVDRLGAAMLVALVVVSPIGLGQAAAVGRYPVLLLAGAGVGVCSSVIPYVCDQLAMARLPRSTFALLLALLPATAALLGAVVLRQVPSPPELAGIALVAAGVAAHRNSAPEPREITQEEEMCDSYGSARRG
jgi:inner membrane transporter RhtA